MKTEVAAAADGSCPVFVVNLPKDVSRKERISAHLAGLGMRDVRVIEAVRGASLSDDERKRLYDDARARTRKGYSFSPGEIGCALSHLKIYQSMVDEGIPWALVLEDDALLSVNAPAVISAAGSWVVHPEPRVLLLTPMIRFMQRGYLPLLSPYRNVRMWRAWISTGYLINLSAARDFLRVNQPVHILSDDWIRYRQFSAVDVRGVDPFCIGLHESTLDSNIAAERKANKKLRRSHYYVFRERLQLLWRRVAEALWIKPLYGLGKHKRNDRP
ncbi:MAG: glycosyltransferase family 25 protein [Pseudomonadota bacterium]